MNAPAPSEKATKERSLLLSRGSLSEDLDASALRHLGDFELSGCARDYTASDES
jgi:hypothetical protein